jgi:outer membrane protein assembly factor BamB
MEDLRLQVVCVASADGRILWDRRIRARLPEREFSGYMVNHGYASASPTSDGKAVYAFFGRSGAWAFDLEGKLLWKVSLGDKTHEFGTGGSPIVYDHLVIFNATVESGALVALNKATGEEVWRTEKLPASWATPVMLSLPSGERELVFNVAKRVYAFDPEDGKTLWECAYGGDVAFGSVTIAGDTVYVSGGNNGKATAAVRGGGRGDVTQSHLLWEIKKASKIPTLLIHEGLLYCIGDGGIARCLRPASGEIVYEQRLSRIYPWASPIVAEDKIYVVGKGRVVVLAVGREYKELAVNEMFDGGRFHATPAVDGKRLLIRSDGFLYGVEK